MSDAVSKLAILRGRAQAKREKKGKQIKSETLLAIVAEFLNTGNDQTTVENTYLTTNPTKAYSAIEAAFNKVIDANNLSHLVACVSMGDEDHVYLVNMNEETENDEDENES